jgi:hypothetical protein
LDLLGHRLCNLGVGMAVDQGVVVVLEIKVLESINIDEGKSLAVLHKGWKWMIKRHTPGIAARHKFPGSVVKFCRVRPFRRIGGIQFLYKLIRFHNIFLTSPFDELQFLIGGQDLI